MNGRLFMRALFVVSLVFLFAGAAYKGPFISVDTDKFLKTGNGAIAWLASTNWPLADLWELRLFPDYLISSTVLSGVYTSLGLGAWGVITLNIVLFSFIVCAVFGIWCNTYPEIRTPWNNKKAGLAVCGGMYVIFGLPDGFLWSYAVLTDVIFLFWISMCIALILKGFYGGSRLLWVWALAIAVTSPFVRPPGVVIPLLFLWGLILHLTVRPDRDLKVLIAVGFAVPVVIAGLAIPYLVLTYTGKGLMGDWIGAQYLNDYIHFAVVLFKQGTIISNRLEITPPDPLSYLHVLKIMMYRLVYYFVPIRIDEHSYSLLHNLVNTVYMVLVVPLFAKGVVSLWQMDHIHRSVALFLGSVAFWFALLHAVTLVSFDWRYQLPAMVPLWVIAGYGLFSILGLRRADAA